MASQLTTCAGIGMLVPLATVPLLNAVVFASFAQARAALLGQTDRPMTAFESSVAGAWAGFVNSCLADCMRCCFTQCSADWIDAVIASPVELIKNRLQIQYSAADRKYAGPWDCMKKIVAEEGVRGLFRGMNAVSRPCLNVREHADDVAHPDNHTRSTLLRCPSREIRLICQSGGLLTPARLVLHVRNAENGDPKKRPSRAPRHKPAVVCGWCRRRCMLGCIISTGM